MMTPTEAAAKYTLDQMLAWKRHNKELYYAGKVTGDAYCEKLIRIEAAIKARLEVEYA